MPRAASLTLSVGIMILAGYGIFAATGWPWKAALFPLAIGIPLFCLAAVEALWTLFGSAQTGRNEMEVALTTAPGAQRRIPVAVAWMLGFFCAGVLLGFPLAVPLFLFLYLKLQGGEGWL